MAKKFEAKYSDALLLQYAYGMLSVAKAVQNGEASEFITGRKWLNDNKTLALIEARVAENNLKGSKVK